MIKIIQELLFLKNDKHDRPFPLFINSKLLSALLY